MVGKPYVAPNPCSKCLHKQALQIDTEGVDAFAACFAEYLRIKESQTSPQLESSKMDTESDFLQSLFLDLEQIPSAGLESSGSSGSSNSSNGDDGTPATELSPTSPPKFGELDLDGFTPGTSMFAVESSSRTGISGSTTNPDYMNYKSTSNAFSEAITPGKTVFSHPTLSSHTSQFQHQLSNSSQFKPSLSIQPPQQRPNQHQAQNSSGSMDDFSPLIDPALTSYNGLPSAIESEFDTTFSQAPSEPPSAIEPQSAISTKSKTALKSSSTPEEPLLKDGKAQPKRKRARKTTPTSPADAEKQARFLERNRNAASRCRARRKAQNDRLEIRASELERERDGLRLLQQSLMSEKAELLGRVLDLGCGDSCNGVEGLGSIGSGAGKPPRDLLMSALGELVMGSPSEQHYKEESVDQDDTDMLVA